MKKDMKQIWKYIVELTTEIEEAHDNKMVWAEELLTDTLKEYILQADVYGDELEELLTAIVEDGNCGDVQEDIETYLPRWVEYDYVKFTRMNNNNIVLVTSCDFVLLVEEGKIKHLSIN